jgi:hypothetical protein
MSLAVYSDANWNGLKLVAESCEDDCGQKARILTALGLSGNRLPQVDDKNLARYYEYLAKNLSLPFRAHYPEPTTPLEEITHSCTVLELLDPAKYVSDEFSGIFCKTRKGKYEVNLPLVELEVPQDDPNFQLIEDYWYWFWNWR